MTPRMKHKVNYGSYVIMMCHNRFINCNKYTTQVGNADKKGGYPCVGAEAIWEISIPSLNFFVNLKLFSKYLNK